MVLIRVSKVIKASPERVFRFMTNLERFSEFDPGITKVTITSTIKEGVGVKSHWILDREGKHNEWDEEIVEWIPYDCYMYRVTTKDKEYLGIHLFEPSNGGTKNTFIVIPLHQHPNADWYRTGMQGLLDHAKENIEAGL